MGKRGFGGWGKGRREANTGLRAEGDPGAIGSELVTNPAVLVENCSVAFELQGVAIRFWMPRGAPLVEFQGNEAHGLFFTSVIQEARL